MKIERLILIPFFGNYIINNVVAAIAAMFPAPVTEAVITTQYIVFVVCAVIASLIFAWWYLGSGSRMATLKWGAIFGVVGFLVSVATTFVSGIAGVVLQTGSITEAMGVLPNFVPFLWNWSTLVVLGYWLVPALLVGWYFQMTANKSAPMI